MSRTILVTGGTGRIGSELVRLLSLHPDAPTIRVGTRSPDGAKARLLYDMAPDQVFPVAFDDNDPTSLAEAARGIDALFVIAPFTPDMAAWHQRVIDGIKAVAEPYVVKVSVTGAREPEGEPRAIPERHGAGEKIIRDSGLPNTAIRPTIFAQHFGMSPVLYTPGNDRFFLPTGKTQVAFLDCRDIAAMGAALVMLSESERAPYLGKASELTGSAAVSGDEIATILSRVSGREITHVDGEEAFVARAAELGVPDGIKAIYGEAAGGWFSKVEHDPFTALVGRKPRTFSHYAMDHAPLFARR